MGFFYFDSGQTIAPLLYAIFFLTYTIVVFFIGQKVIPIMYIIFSLGAVQDIDFINCTIFFIILNLSYIFPKWKYALFISYLLDVCIVCFRRNETPFHLIAHICFCFIFYLGIEVIKAMNKDALLDMFRGQKKLELTENEEIVIRQRAEGKLMKEISEFSKNTKTKYIKDAMKRNNCRSQEELISLYILQNKNN